MLFLSSDAVIPSETGMALFYENQSNSTAARHSGFFFPMRIGKKKTGIYESKWGAPATLWIPGFFGRGRTH